MRTGPALLLILGGLSCSSSSGGSASAAFDPFAYVPKSKSTPEARRAVRLLNTPASDPLRSGMAASPETDVEKLGRLGFALLAEEIRERGLRSPDAIYYVQNNPDDPLVYPALFDRLLKAKTETGIGRLTREVLGQGIASLRSPADWDLHVYLNCLIEFGRLSVPHLCERLRTGDDGVRQIAWDLLALTLFDSELESVYREARDRSRKGGDDWSRAAQAFTAWWEQNREALGWKPASYSFAP
jgi:hypothetical protein